MFVGSSRNVDEGKGLLKRGKWGKQHSGTASIVGEGDVISRDDEVLHMKFYLEDINQEKKSSSAGGRPKVSLAIISPVKLLESYCVAHIVMY